jgi:hypothetical protein
MAIHERAQGRNGNSVISGIARSFRLRPSRDPRGYDAIDDAVREGQRDSGHYTARSMFATAR